jgi:translation elongation factor EF-Tu-like GTPase
MSHQQVKLLTITITLVMSLLSACAGSTPTPIVIIPEAASTPIPPIPTRELPPPAIETEIPTTVATEDLTTTAEPTATIDPAAPTEDPLEQPFLMRIDRVSVIVGRGTLVEGRVARGILQANSAVEILGPQNSVVSSSVLAVLISNALRDQVSVGEYAGILLQGIEANEVIPGMLLSEAGTYDSYEEALQELN